jgi:hypothetical protein
MVEAVETVDGETVGAGEVWRYFVAADAFVIAQIVSRSRESSGSGTYMLLSATHHVYN